MTGRLRAIAGITAAVIAAATGTGAPVLDTDHITPARRHGDSPAELLVAPLAPATPETATETTTVTTTVVTTVTTTAPTTVTSTETSTLTTTETTTSPTTVTSTETSTLTTTETTTVPRGTVTQRQCDNGRITAGVCPTLGPLQSPPPTSGAGNGLH
jgi:hypothetical protein